MFKTLSVSIGQTPFIIEEKAFATLENYLQAIRAHFASTGDAEEIVSDIESRIAEEFSGALGKNRKVIEQRDIDAVIANMGTLEDFQKFDDGQMKSEPQESSSKKLRLYRDADDQVLGGVAAGIAKYFNIDPIIVRLAFGLSIFLGGFGIVLYIILWVALPEARTTAEKVEMTGGRVTLSALQHRIDEVLPPETRKSTLQKIFTFPFRVIGAVLRGIGKVLRVIFPVLGRIIGGVITIAAAFAIAGLTFALLAMLLNPNSPYIGLPLHDAVSSIVYVTLLLCGYLFIFMPILFVILLGASLISMRNVFTTGAVVSLGCIWLAATIIGGVTGFSAAPQLEPAFAQYNEQSEKTYPLTNFTSIAADEIDHIEVTRGDAFSVTLVGNKRAHAMNEPIVEKGNLILRKNEDTDRCMIFCFSRRATLKVTMPKLDAVGATNASRVSLTGFSGIAMELHTSDIGRIAGDISVRDLTLTMSDASRIDLAGSGTNVTATLQDIARLDAERMVIQNASLTLKDASRATIDVRGSLKGTASDISRIDLLTEPKTKDVQTSDVGSVRVRGDEERGEWNY